MKSIAILLATNIFTGTAFYLIMTEDFNSSRREESHYVDHVTLDNAKLTQFILYENKGLTHEEFKQKYGINIQQDNKDSINYKMLYFTFKNGILDDVE